jgi:hypothetical protein
MYRRLVIVALGVLAALAVMGTGVVAAKTAIVSETRCEFVDHANACRRVNDSARRFDVFAGAIAASGVIGIAAMRRRRARGAGTFAVLTSVTLVAWYALMSYWAWTATLGPSAW